MESISFNDTNGTFLRSFVLKLQTNTVSNYSIHLKIGHIPTKDDGGEMKSLANE